MDERIRFHFTRVPNALRRRLFWSRVFAFHRPFRRTWFRVPFTSWGVCVETRVRLEG